MSRRAERNVAYRTPAGDVILRAVPAAGPARPASAGRALRLAALVLGLVAFAAALTAAVAVIDGGDTLVRPAPNPATLSTAPGSAPPRPAPIRPYPDPVVPEGSDAGADAGGIAAARERVAEFVSALNGADFRRANGLLCRVMIGSYNQNSLEGIVPGSIGVGGVMVQHASGTAIITYRSTDGSDAGRAVFGLVVENHQWMLCLPR